MATGKLREAIDQLGSATDNERKRLAHAAAAATSATGLFGLRYRAGEQVLDVLSGRTVTVEEGWIDRLTQRELYLVRFGAETPDMRARSALEPLPNTPQKGA
jgi:hypothetical protein